MKHLDRLCTEPGRALLLLAVMSLVVGGAYAFGALPC